MDLLLPSADTLPPQPAALSTRRATVDLAAFEAALAAARESLWQSRAIFGNAWLGGFGVESVIPSSGLLTLAPGVAQILAPSSEPSGVDGCVRVEITSPTAVTITDGDWILALRYDAGAPPQYVSFALLATASLTDAGLTTALPLYYVHRSAPQQTVVDIRPARFGTRRSVQQLTPLPALEGAHAVPIAMPGALLWPVHVAAAIRSTEALWLTFSAVVTAGNAGGGDMKTPQYIAFAPSQGDATDGFQLPHEFVIPPAPHPAPPMWTCQSLLLHEPSSRSAGNPVTVLHHDWLIQSPAGPRCLHSNGLLAVVGALSYTGLQLQMASVMWSVVPVRVNAPLSITHSPV